MARIAILPIAALIALAASPALAKDTPSGEQQLARLLAGRVAGKPMDCIPLLTADENVQVIDKTAIVYGGGDVIYVNRPSEADQLSSDDMLIDEPTNDEVCSIDTITLRDRYTNVYDGFVGLGQFVPYTRVPKKS
ncbi:MAG: hypothetical protein KGK11_10940 [Sphingomonadales bacterium]|nr:hypothetical protein [Sphingomonadales bacterium]